MKEWPTEWRIAGLLPGESPRVWQLVLKTSEIPSGGELLAFRVVNPLSNGMPLRFANTAERQQADGWFRIGSLTASRDRSANGNSASMGRAERITRSDSRGWLLQGVGERGN